MPRAASARRTGVGPKRPMAAAGAAARTAVARVRIANTSASSAAAPSGTRSRTRVPSGAERGEIVGRAASGSSKPASPPRAASARAAAAARAASAALSTATSTSSPSRRPGAAEERASSTAGVARQVTQAAQGGAAAIQTAAGTASDEGRRPARPGGLQGPERRAAMKSSDLLLQHGQRHGAVGEDGVVERAHVEPRAERLLPPPAAARGSSARPSCRRGPGPARRCSGRSPCVTSCSESAVFGRHVVHAPAARVQPMRVHARCPPPAGRRATSRR